MERLLTKKDVCAMLQITTRTFDRWRSLWKAKGLDTGEVKIRNTVRFKAEAIEAIMKNKRYWL